MTFRKFLPLTVGIAAWSPAGVAATDDLVTPFIEQTLGDSSPIAVRDSVDGHGRGIFARRDIK